MDLLTNALKLAIRDLLAKKNVKARVVDKINSRGEIVIGVVIDRDQKPDPPPT